MNILGLNKYKFVSPVDFLPYNGVQSIEESKCLSYDSLYDINSDIGFCVVWTMFYIEQRLHFEHKSRTEIVKGIMKYVDSGTLNDNACKVVRDYAGFVIKLYYDKSYFQRLKIHLLYNKNVYFAKAIENVKFYTIALVYLYLTHPRLFRFRLI
jgi:hypothetical protein